MKLTVVVAYYEAVETYSCIGLLRSYGNLQLYWTTTKLWKLTVVLAYYEAMETYSCIELLRSNGNLQSYWPTTKLWKLTVVLNYYEAKQTNLSETKNYFTKLNRRHFKNFGDCAVTNLSPTSQPCRCTFQFTRELGVGLHTQ
jgi:hypothetical protein